MPRVIAIQRGHDGAVVREPGEAFEVSEARLKDGSTWFVPEDKVPEPAPAEANPRPPGAGPLRGSQAVAEDNGQGNGQGNAS
jgi:hypothetical protein